MHERGGVAMCVGVDCQHQCGPPQSLSGVYSAELEAFVQETHPPTAEGPCAHRPQYNKPFLADASTGGLFCGARARARSVRA